MFRSPPSERDDAVKMQPKKEPVEAPPKLNVEPVKPDTPENKFAFFALGDWLVPFLSTREGAYSQVRSISVDETYNL